MATGNVSEVDTKLFDSVADSIQSSVKEMERLTQEWNGVVANLRSEWQGDTSVNFNNTMEQIKKSDADLLSALSAYPILLRELAGIYDKTEQNVQETGKTLTFDHKFR
jgi:WXG100 family type VII secretion target